MAKKRVLVTGATGLIGRHVVNALHERGAEVHAVTRSLKHDTTDREFHWHRANLLDQRERIQLLDSAEPDAIVHCAWVTEHGTFWTAPENVDWAAATICFAREARERGATRFVGVGTCAEYEWGGDAPFSEQATNLKPTTLYGIAKDATRRVLEIYATTVGLSYAWARVFMLFGQGENENRFVASLSRALNHGEPAKMGSGTATRDLLDARDVGAAIAALAISSVTGAVNIASGRPVTLRDVAETLAGFAGRLDLLRLGAYPDRADDPQVIRADVTRLTNEVGFKPRIPLEQGLRDALAYGKR